MRRSFNIITNRQRAKQTAASPAENSEINQLYRSLLGNFCQFRILEFSRNIKTKSFIENGDLHDIELLFFLTDGPSNKFLGGSQ